MLAEKKKEQRQMATKYRQRLTDRELLKKSMEIKKKLFELEEFEAAENIMFFVSFNNEVRTEFMIKEALKLGKNVILPITDREENRLLLSQLEDYDQELEESTYGILEPKEEYIRLIEPTELDLVVSPGLAFDRELNRLGYGGGYYDRLLSQAPQADKVAIAFHIQIVDEVVVGDYDIPMDKVVTEQEVIE
ncbi:5-formyltetrahydrofolate cyclo-ligase [Natroniella sulfidigena]|uniref:5-formyltetrahydrofolate cyclo-ligase n=1 Tax=Natroniella sulfidigena TaxID=723921 RepID=UPI002009FF01|nr:5-formyltetrahydrofolate cyclo-ligase [Natroniella sulfidigena]MCK8815983.1 5-formyltetrahydrofolate cyclo-ligase [Natroniella sulfidigena]